MSETTIVERPAKVKNRLIVGGKHPVLLCPNKSLLFKTENGWRRVPLRNVPMWRRMLAKICPYNLPGQRKEAFNRLVKLLAGDWPKALAVFRLAGRLRKRLMLQAYDFRELAVLLVTEFPYAEADAARCPAVLAIRIRHMLFNGNPVDPKRVNWLGTLKILTAGFSRPAEVNWPLKTFNDLRVAQAFYDLSQQAKYAQPDRVAEVRRRLLQVAAIRNDLHRLPTARILFTNVSDGVRMARHLREWGLPVPTFDPAQTTAWHDEISRTYQQECRRRANVEYLANLEASCPGEGLIPDLEHERIKTGRDLVAAGDELRHCVGSYAGWDDYVHYRRGSVICQVSVHPRMVTQCFDACNRITDDSRDYEAEVIYWLTAGG